MNDDEEFDGDEAKKSAVEVPSQASIVASARARALERGGGDHKVVNMPRGRAYQPSDKDRAYVSAMVAAGVAKADVAAVMGLTAKELQRAFAFELSTASTIAVTAVAQNLFRIATGETAQAASAGQFWLSRRAGWRETTNIEHGGAIGVVALDYSGLTKEERAALRSMIAARKERDDGELIDVTPESD